MILKVICRIFEADEAFEEFTAEIGIAKIRENTDSGYRDITVIFHLCVNEDGFTFDGIGIFKANVIGREHEIGLIKYLAIEGELILKLRG